MQNFQRHYVTNRAPFGLFYHAAWFTQPHHRTGFEAFIDTLVDMDDVWLVTTTQAIEFMRELPNFAKATPEQIRNFLPFSCTDKVSVTIRYYARIGRAKIFGGSWPYDFPKIWDKI